MRKGFSAIGAVSVVISFMAAVVLCMQSAQIKTLSDWQPPGFILWPAEIALFGTAVLIWRRSASLAGWVIGVIALALLRVALSMTCAFALVKTRPSLGFSLALDQMTACEPRFAAALFSLMIFYPIRVLLPPLLSRRGKAVPPASGIETHGSASLWLVRGDEKLQVTLANGNGKKDGPAKTKQDVVTFTGPPQIDGVIKLPLRAILPRIPQDCLVGGEARYDPARLVPIPLSLIVPQLKEAQILIPLEAMCSLLPSNLLTIPEDTGLDGEPLFVSLALEDVIPELPGEVLELPAPSLPAWAELPDPENVVFAKV